MKLAQTACSDIVEEDSFSSSVASVLQMKKMEDASNLHSPVESEVCITLIIFYKQRIKFSTRLQSQIFNSRCLRVLLNFQKKLRIVA